MKKNRTHSNSFGIVLIILGLIFAAVNFNWFPANFSKIIFSWQMLLIAFGLISLFKRHFLTGIILFVVGGFFIVPRIAKIYPELAVPANFVSLYWPLLLIFAGILIILCHLYGKHDGNFHVEHHFQCKKNFHKKEYTHNEDFHKVNVLGHGEYFVIDTEFKGGTLKAIFGNIELDLRKAILLEGDTYLQIEAIFSGITLIVPEDWVIESQIEVIVSGIEDRHKSSVSNKRLILTGSAVFSGVEIQN